MAGLITPSSAATLLKAEEVKPSVSVGKQMPIPADVHEGSIIHPEKCPSCKEMALVNENGCFICRDCGFTKCE